MSESTKEICNEASQEIAKTTMQSRGRHQKVMEKKKLLKKKGFQAEAIGFDDRLDKMKKNLGVNHSSFGGSGSGSGKPQDYNWIQNILGRRVVKNKLRLQRKY